MYRRVSNDWEHIHVVASSLLDLLEYGAHVWPIRPEHSRSFRGIGLSAISNDTHKLQITQRCEHPL